MKKPVSRNPRRANRIRALSPEAIRQVIGGGEELDGESKGGGHEPQMDNSVNDIDRRTPVEIVVDLVERIAGNS